MYKCVCKCVLLYVCAHACMDGYMYSTVFMHVCMYVYMYVRTVLEIRSKWWMDKCPSGDILGQTISALLGHMFGHINNSVTALCVCISNEHLVALSQMSDPDFFGSDKMSKWSGNV